MNPYDSYDFDRRPPELIQIARTLIRMHPSPSQALTYWIESSALEKCWMAMATEQQPALLRVSIDEDGRFDIVDFTTPARDGRLLFYRAPQETVPAWVIESISLLRITEARSVVLDVGFKVQDRVYYIVDKRGDHETN